MLVDALLLFPCGLIAKDSGTLFEVDVKWQQGKLLNA